MSDVGQGDATTGSIPADRQSVTAATAPPPAADGGVGWVASWSTSIAGPFGPVAAPGSSVPAYMPQPDLSFALPGHVTDGARDQTIRMIVKPDVWGTVARVRLSNVFGTVGVTFSAVSVALQEYQANLVDGTSVALTFGGRPEVTIPPGERIFSDPVTLPFVGRITPRWLAGRNLAVSLAVRGASGPISAHHDGLVTGYLSSPGSGDQTGAPDDHAFPHTINSVLFVDAVDVRPADDTLVVCAFGDSLTDGTFSTPGGYDRWSNAMSRRLHAALGDRVSVVNQGIGGNAVAAAMIGPPATARVHRDVLGLSGLDVVVWLEGINDLGIGRGTPGPVRDGYRQVVDVLHDAGVQVVGATIPPALTPGGTPPADSPLWSVGPELIAHIGGPQLDRHRRELNEFILTSGVFDATADLAGAVTDPATGTLRAPFVPSSAGSAGDYLHPNRAAYQVMGRVAADAVLTLRAQPEFPSRSQ
ncbi:GDSL-type esterase/lipase family protein [Frankia sp. R82]|uniref:GDSL-type esterase/lipase family protein n=1 Tax=Frankia sp. R82 TaxID=2950553 RepID=UPI0020431788|nr:GDSL-type esterase/lipase family protein [Frankia sp. R82]MCM3882686.1 GDSL-type esterase/lipase family protein [Frankia sp. R82]